MLATVGLKPCETTDELNIKNSGCQLSPNPADGYDAAFGGPLCTPCAATGALTKTPWRTTMSSFNTESDAISLADLSATHRDLLWVLSQTGASESRSLYHALSDYYTDGVDKSRVCDTLKELIEHDLVTTQTHDTNEYRITESARRALSARQAWQAGTHNAEGGHE